MEIEEAIENAGDMLKFYDKTACPDDQISLTYDAFLREIERLQKMVKLDKRSKKGGIICPRCGQAGEMFTSDLDWCSKCKYSWSSERS